MTENLSRLGEVLGRLIAAGLNLKPSKCHILQREVLFLSHTVSATGLQPNPRLIDAVVEWKAPTNRREVQQYLGLCNYYRRFIPEFSALACPLTRLTSKDVPFLCDEDTQASFESLKRALCSAPILSFPEEGGEYILDTDPSDVGIGAVLQQVQDGEERVLAYASKKSNKQQRRYCVTRHELLAIVVFLREFRNYLLGQHFIIRTDHGSLTWLLNFKEPQGQLARWMEYVFQFRFRIVHCDGKKHGNADVLSQQTSGETQCSSYQPKVALQDLPCGGCPYCTKCHRDWVDFAENMDDVVPLSEVCPQVVTRNQAQKARECVSSNTSSPPEPVQGSSTEPSTEVPTCSSPACVPAAAVWDEVPLATADWVSSFTPEELRKAQSEDPDLRVLQLWLANGKKPSREEAASLGPALRSYWLNF